MKISELPDNFEIETNEYQTKITKELLASLKEEVAEQLIDFVENVEYIHWLVSPNRPRAKDLPRDEQGRIIVNLTKPHILEDMDYFRPAGKHFEKHKCYTFLRPNKNPNSEFYKWFVEERRRCREGYVRESDGEWVTGYMYWYINYSPIMLTKTSKKSKKANRVEGFPLVWEGVYLRFHYLYQARENGMHAIELSRRGSGKSFCLASMMAKNLILGESSSMRKRVNTILTAYTKEYLASKDGTLSKFVPMIDFVADNTGFPRLRLRSSIKDMYWQMGYLDKYGREKGTLNMVVGVSSKDDPSKVRGKRGFVYIEEMGSFKGLEDLYNNIRPGMEEGDYTFGMAYLVGTAGDKDSDFEGAKSLLYNPKANKIYPLKNVYDKKSMGGGDFGYFFPAYLNRLGCQNKDGVSDVVKALIEILNARYEKKYSNDPSSLLKNIAEMPITPAEAVMKVKSDYFPSAALSERLYQLDADAKAYNDVYIGELVLENGVAKFKPTDDIPIRKYPLKEGPALGALEIFEMPQKNTDGDVLAGRYIIGHDPVDNDEAESTSLSSTFVFDLFTDKIVAEYTGRHKFAEENYEIVRMLCMFYNAKCLYESNRKGIFAYFQKMNSTYMLAQTPEYLRDKQIVKYSSFGSNGYGVNANNAINSYADSMLRDWFLKPCTVFRKNEEGVEEEVTVPMLYSIRNRALLQEAIAYDSYNNFDRIRAMGMVMIYREEKLALYRGNVRDALNDTYARREEDPFFARNYKPSEMSKSTFSFR